MTVSASNAVHAAPDSLSSGDALRVISAGAATLVVELALIRWIPGQLRVLGYFSNFVLLAAFLGFGVGMLAVRRWPQVRWLSWLAPLTLCAIVGAADLGTTLQVLPSADEFLFLEYRTHGAKLPLYPFLSLSFCLLAASVVPLGHVVGRTLEGSRPLFRYGLNVLGSLAGVLVFAWLSASGAPPWLWMLVASASSAVGCFGAPLGYRALGLFAVLGTTAIAAHAGQGATWSPYQKISTGPVHLHPTLGVVQEWRIPTLTAEQRRELVQLPESEGFTVRVNDDSYQTPIDLRPAAVSRRPGLQALARQYDLPFMRKARPRHVLVLGAGSGNDVAAALRAGAERVDAVDIDPVIVGLGQRHPEHPYADARVHVHIDDARSFLARTDQHWDAIVFGLIDSHVLASQKANVRLDSFVFTRESFVLARSHLTPDGVMFLSHAVGTPWFFERMRATLAAAFGRPPMVVTGKVWHPIGVIYAAGSRIGAGEPVDPNVALLTDDWPFVYLARPSVPLEYAVVIVLVLLASLLAVRGVAGPRWHRVDPHFFALGAGFLLLETRSLTVLALHLGATWQVNAAVFAGVLMMALFSTYVASRKAQRAGNAIAWDAYVLLSLFLASSYFVPVSALSVLPTGMRILCAIVLVCLPLLASGVVFGTSLARAGAADRALASNLLGAMLGGLVEYSSMIVGLRALILLAAAFYLVALFADLRQRA